MIIGKLTDGIEVLNTIRQTKEKNLLKRMKIVDCGKIEEKHSEIPLDKPSEIPLDKFECYKDVYTDEYIQKDYKNTDEYIQKDYKNTDEYIKNKFKEIQGELKEYDKEIEELHTMGDKIKEIDNILLQLENEKKDSVKIIIKND